MASGMVVSLFGLGGGVSFLLDGLLMRFSRECSVRASDFSRGGGVSRDDDGAMEHIFGPSWL